MILYISIGGMIMFGLTKKEVNQKNINEGYRDYEKNPDKIMIICIDEQKHFDALHIDGAECFPLRLINQFEDYYPNKDIIYYIYSLNKYYSEKACKKLIKKNYTVYDLGSFTNYHEKEAGYNARKRDRRRRKK